MTTLFHPVQTGRWWRWQGATTAKGSEVDHGRDVYVFKWKDGQVTDQGRSLIWDGSYLLDIMVLSRHIADGTDKICGVHVIPDLLAIQ